MERKEKRIEYFIVRNEADLRDEERQLLKRAEYARESAYAPYSGYRVGAAVLLENGKMTIGSNQENVAYPAGLCAERVALFYASSRFPDTPIKAIAVTARSEDFDVSAPVTPCGSCRQVLSECESRYGRKIRIIMRGENGDILIVEGIENLLPLMFRAEQLKKAGK